MAVYTQDINGRQLQVGASVAVRCTILSLNPTAPNSALVEPLGAGDTITVQVSSWGNIGEVTPGPIFTISGKQCQFAMSNGQLHGN